MYLFNSVFVNLKKLFFCWLELYGIGWGSYKEIENLLQQHLFSSYKFEEI